MLKPLLYAMLVWSVGAADGGSIVQFLVSAEGISDVIKVFPGASVDYTWNNVFVVTVWTDDPSTAIPAIQATLSRYPNLHVLISPYTMTVATQRWLEYNMVWVLVLILTFIAGCVCGSAIIGNVCGYKKKPDHVKHKCRALF